MSLQTIDYDRLGLRDGQRVLDLGCGEGRHSILAYLHAEVSVVALDLSHEDLSTAVTRLADFEDKADHARQMHPCQASGLQLPFAEHTFDVIICSEVLEHVPDYQRVLAEIRRVLKPGGRLAVSVPRFVPEWICWQLSEPYHNVAGGHIRIFRSSELKTAVQVRGFQLTDRHWAHALHVPYWWLRCLFWDRGETAWPVRTYHKLLVWDLMQAPRLTRLLDRLLNPLLGKSIVFYFNDRTAA